MDYVLISVIIDYFIVFLYFFSKLRAYMAEHMAAIVSQPFNLTCSVVSKGEFTLYWYKGNKQIGEPLFYE